jgi:hypothetical protein
MKPPCFDVSKNGKKIVRAGVRGGVVSLILTWVGNVSEASKPSASKKGPVAGLTLRVGGIDQKPDGDKRVEWLDNPRLCVGDEIHIRITDEEPDKPLRSERKTPHTISKEGVQLAECSFCLRMQRSDPTFRPAIRTPDHFICTRCLILAERMLDEDSDQLFHLHRTTGKKCLLCSSYKTKESVSAWKAHVCRACIDKTMKHVIPN